MSSQFIPVDPFDYVVFGGTGDLALRKLLPSLYQREVDHQLPELCRIIGASRSAGDDEVYRSKVINALRKYVSDERLDEEALQRFIQRIHYVSVDAKTDQGWSELTALLSCCPERIRAFYLSVDPSLYETICEQIEKQKLITQHTRVVLEKPIGTDGASARDINDAVGRYFSEHQVYRIDHYLGKETVQNLMALRFANMYFEPIWNAHYIDHIQITAAETLGLEGRSYYANVGALRDMVQNHLLQLLCLVAMEPPASMNADAVRDEKLKVLKSLAPILPEQIAKNTVRGQYTHGWVEGKPVEGYREDIAAETGSCDNNTETFVALNAQVNNWRWAGVPFYLRTGKRMKERLSEIVIQFKQLPHSIFDDVSQQIHKNRLVIRLQPRDAVEQYLMIKDPGPGGFRLRQVPLDMSFADNTSVRNPDAYERLLLDIIRGNQTLFMRRDEVEAAWAWVDPILNAWKSSTEAPKEYPAGSWGPDTNILTGGQERHWHEELK